MKETVRIIGGGPAALAAAFELTSGACAGKYDVTIYQPGWRLGGKCASGRNPADGFGKRIEEHGLHVFFGCYANTRQILDRCYEELNNSGAPYKFASFDEAFDPIDQVVLGQHADDSWQFVTLEFPRDQDSPNFGGFVSDAVSWISRSLRRLIAEDNDAPSVDDDGWWNQIEPTLSMLGVDTSETLIDDRLEQFARGMSRIHREMTGTFVDIAKADDPAAALNRLMTFVGAALPERPGEPAEVRFFRDTVQLLVAVIKGVWKDHLLDKGFDAINHLELATWLRDSGDLELEQNPLHWPALLRAVYDGCFAFAEGDPDQPSIAAGRAIQGAIRCLFHYEGAAIYRPHGSMSDTVIGPIARVLEQRGVKVEFFHAVTALRPSADGEWIESLDVVQQLTDEQIAELRDEHARMPADPKLVTWPSDLPTIPNASELEHGPFRGTLEPTPLNREHVILAVPPEVQKQICAELRAHDESYDAMLKSSRSIATQAAQLWLKDSADVLGQDFQAASLLSCFVEPLDTMADMAHVVDVEDWAGDVRHIAYLCGALPEQPDQGAADAEARAHLERFIDNDLKALWPGIGARLDRNRLHPPGSAADPLAGQYVRANWSPPERYVLTPPGSVKDRLTARGTRFKNLLLAGDWTASGLDVGCLEAAVTSGRLAAREICGPDAVTNIVGVDGPPSFPNHIGAGGSSRGPDRRGRLPGRLHTIFTLASTAVSDGTQRLLGVDLGALRDRFMHRRRR